MEDVVIGKFKTPWWKWKVPKKIMRVFDLLFTGYLGCELLFWIILGLGWVVLKIID